MREKTEIIPFIHNYCDRWCERCDFTSRCHVFESEQQRMDTGLEVDEEAFWQNLMGMFSEAKYLLNEKADELGIDLNAINDPDFFERQKQFDEVISNENLTKLSEKYGQDAGTILDSKDDWLIFSPLDEPENLEMLSIIYWYQNFIFIKMQRGLIGILDFNGKEDLEELNDTQSDANGSVKVGLIAIERSINAWKNLLAKENEAQINPILNLLENIKKTAEIKFPKTKDFIRPGFDEVEVVM